MSGKRMSIVVSIVLLMLWGCAKKTEYQNPSASSEHNQFVQDAEQKLADYDARMDTLKSHVSVAGERAKTEMQQDVDSLQADRQRVQIKLDALRTATETTWENAKQEFSVALDSLDAKFDRARARLH